MDKINQIVELLKTGVKISSAIQEVYGNCKLYIPFNDKDFDVSISELELSNRSYNALMRNNLTTVNAVIQQIDKNGWNSIRYFGVMSAKEVFESIVDFAWSDMDYVQKSKFLISISQ